QRLPEFQCHRRNLSGLESGAVIELSDERLRDLFLSLALAIQFAQAFANTSHLVSMLQELLLGEDGTMSTHQKIEIHLCDLVEGFTHIGPVASIAVVDDLRNGVGSRHQITNDHDTRGWQICHGVTVGVAAEFPQLNLFATEEDLRSLMICELRKTRLIPPLHVLPVLLGDDHG